MTGTTESKIIDDTRYSAHEWHLWQLIKDWFLLEHLWALIIQVIATIRIRAALTLFTKPFLMLWDTPMMLVREISVSAHISCSSQTVGKTHWGALDRPDEASAVWNQLLVARFPKFKIENYAWLLKHSLVSDEQVEPFISGLKCAELEAR